MTNRIAIKNLRIRDLEEQLQPLREKLKRSQGSFMFQYGLTLENEIERLRSELAATKYEITEIGKEATAGLNGDLERADAALQRIDLLSKNILATHESKESP